MSEMQDERAPFPGSEVYSRALADIKQRAERKNLSVQAAINRLYDNHDEKDLVVFETAYSHACENLSSQPNTDHFNSFRLGAAAAVLVFSEFAQRAKPSDESEVSPETRVIQLRAIIGQMPRLAENRVLESGEMVCRWLDEVACTNSSDKYFVKLGAGFVMALKTASEYRRRALEDVAIDDAVFSQVKEWLK